MIGANGPRTGRARTGIPAERVMLVAGQCREIRRRISESNSCVWTRRTADLRLAKKEFCACRATFACV